MERISIGPESWRRGGGLLRGSSRVCARRSNGLMRIGAAAGGCGGTQGALEMAAEVVGEDWRGGVVQTRRVVPA
jgi:hypothetical protein